MTENKRFYKGDYTNCWYDICEIEKDEEVICTVALKDADFIIEIFEENEKLEKENEQLKKALLFYIDVALCETSSNFNKDFDNICNNLFGCSYNEIKHLYLDIGVEDDVFELFQR